MDIISKKTRIEFREYFVGTSLSTISQEFDSADVVCDWEYDPPETGQRRSLVEQYYHSVDWSKWSDVRKILTVYENVLLSVEDIAENGQEWAENAFKFLKKWIERDGFRYENGRLTSVRNHQALAGIADAVGHLDMPELHRQIERMNAAVEADPALAIGTAKELVETVCKTILAERSIDLRADADVPKLVKETRQALGLVPESIPNSAKGADAIRRLLSNLGNVAQGLGELRNLYGTGHGKDGSVRGLGPRHARLAVGAAGTLATFLLETHLERSI
ncbi:MAG: abortive infection family protein [Gammaproteobacteria bacterium]|nr:abortive infection family protein [Gammaproteobacteria bacterium]